MSRELVSYVICTYNQEKYIGEALEAAFNQTYSPLEIIISDDCSTDCTFNIINSAVKCYSGPHLISINKNEKNLGIAKHWDYISRKAKGGLIIHAAGDDISLPHRVEELVLAWTSTYPRPVLLSSNGINMSIAGENRLPVKDCSSLDHALIQYYPVDFDLDKIDIPVCGFALAVDRSLYSIFDPIVNRMWSEDEILRSRALLIGSIMFIPKILVRYRDGGLSKGAKLNKNSYLDLYKNQAISRIYYLEQILVDIKSLDLSNSNLMSNINKKLLSTKRRFQMINTNNLLVSIWILSIQLFLSKNEGISKLEYIKFFLIRWVPFIFFYIRTRLNKNSPI